MKRYIILFFVCIGGFACVNVKEYQKSKINDSEMSLSKREAESFESSFYLYREGAGGADGGKSGGGCGCN